MSVGDHRWTRGTSVQCPHPGVDAWQRNCCHICRRAWRKVNNRFV